MKNRRYLSNAGKPDYDPEHPYHYHTEDGEKVVITAEDWEANVGKPYFKEIEDAVRAEQAAYPEPEYDEKDNPEFNRVYNILRSRAYGYDGWLAVNYWDKNKKKQTPTPLPEGYTRDSHGVITDSHGNYYTPVRHKKPWTSDMGFENTERDKFGYDYTQRYERIQMPERTIKVLRQPLPVDRVMNVNKERENAIQYLIDNSVKTEDIPFYADFGYLGKDNPYFSPLKSDKDYKYKIIDIDAFNKLHGNGGFKTKEEMLELLKSQNVSTDVLDNFYIGTEKRTKKVNRKEAEKKAVIKIGKLQRRSLTNTINN